MKNNKITFAEKREILLAESKARKQQKEICKQCSHADRYQCDYCLNKR